jgi:lysophospholipase L1-like esterase
MSVGRRLLFTAVTLLLILGIAEIGCRIAWNRIEARAFDVRKGAGEASLVNNSINFMMQADGIYGFALKPGTYGSDTKSDSVPFSYVVNKEGFGQRDSPAITRGDNVLRLAAMGESTTMGHQVDHGNYPAFLRRIVAEFAGDGRRVEMLNAGVAGWVSDQIALRAAHQVAAYRPQIVILYAGWNDFQSYDPYRDAPAQSWFTQTYGNPYRIESDFPLKLPVLAAAAFQYLRSQHEASPALSTTPTNGYSATPQENYRFLAANLDRTVAALRATEPDTTIAICTLVARWPQGGQAAYESALGRTWWMKHWNLDLETASASMRRFNQFLRDYAKDHNLPLIDAEKAFDDLDRGTMLRDFAHFTDEGYELLANVMYEELRRGGYFKGRSNPRLQELLTKYRRVPGAPNQR